MKKGIRYRYYVSQAVLQQREGDAGAIARLPAQEIEELVTARIGGFLGEVHVVLDELGEDLSAGDQKRLIAAAGKLSGQWPQMRVPERRAFLLSIEASIAVGEEECRVSLRRQALRQMLLDEASPHQAASALPRAAAMSGAEDQLILNSPAQLKLCSGEMRLVLPPAHAKEMPSRPNAPLIKALVNAHKWKNNLLSSKAHSILTIAAEEGVTERYISRIVHLAFLAPDIVEAILDGRQPADLELETLRKNIPLAWSAQRQSFGFTK